MPWCCSCGSIVPYGPAPGWCVIRGVEYHGVEDDTLTEPNYYLCPDCAGSVRAWLGVD